MKVLNEGDALAVDFTGNVKCQDDKTNLEFAFHSQLSSQLKFSIIEVDRYLQKGYSDYKGFVQLDKKYEVIRMPPKGKIDDGEGEAVPKVEIKKDFVSKHMVRIPKVSTMVLIRSGAVFRSEGSPSNPKDVCHFQLEVKDVCWKHRRSFGFKGQPHKSFRSKGLARVPSMKSI